MISSYDFFNFKKVPIAKYPQKIYCYKIIKLNLIRDHHVKNYY